MPRTTGSASYNQAVGARLRRRREELGVPQAEIARRLDVSTSYVQSVEAGRGNLTLGQLARIAQALEAFPRIVLEPLTLGTEQAALEDLLGSPRDLTTP